MINISHSWAHLILLTTLSWGCCYQPIYRWGNKDSIGLNNSLKTKLQARWGEGLTRVPDSRAPAVSYPGPSHTCSPLFWFWNTTKQSHIKVFASPVPQLCTLFPWMASCCHSQLSVNVLYLEWAPLSHRMLSVVSSKGQESWASNYHRPSITSWGLIWGLSGLLCA